MSPKSSTSVINATIDHQCQYVSPKGRRCHMLVDQNKQLPNGAHHPTLCAYHADRLRVTVPAVAPEVLAADLLGDIGDFSTARSVNSFLGNLARQLALKRIPRRDAIALAYISQLLLNSLPALERQLDAEEEAEKDAEIDRINARIRQESRERAARRQQQATNGTQVAPHDAGSAVNPMVAGL